jgi:hypothetical protein
MKKHLASWKLARLSPPTPFASSADGERYAYPRQVKLYGVGYGKWDCDYLVDERNVPSRLAVIPPRREMRYISTRGAVPKRDIVLFGSAYDHFDDHPRPDADAFVRYSSLEASLKAHDSAAIFPIYPTDIAAILERDFQDALFQWRGLGNLSDAYLNDMERIGARTECVARFTKFLGGRAVHDRGQITWFADR